MVVKNEVFPYSPLRNVSGLLLFQDQMVFFLHRSVKDLRRQAGEDRRDDGSLPHVIKLVKEDEGPADGEDDQGDIDSDFHVAELQLRTEFADGQDQSLASDGRKVREDFDADPKTDQEDADDEEGPLIDIVPAPDGGDGRRHFLDCHLRHVEHPAEDDRRRKLEQLKELESLSQDDHLYHDDHEVDENGRDAYRQGRNDGGSIGETGYRRRSSPGFDGEGDAKGHDA